MTNPLSTAADGSGGRGANGRFAAGNSIGKGNPHNRAVARLRAALLSTVSTEDIAEVVTALLVKAKSGDVLAIRELLDRTVGKAVLPIISESVDPEFIETRVYFGPRLSREELAAEGVEVIGGPIDGSARVE